MLEILFWIVAVTVAAASGAIVPTLWLAILRLYVYLVDNP